MKTLTLIMEKDTEGGKSISERAAINLDSPVPEETLLISAIKDLNASLEEKEKRGERGDSLCPMCGF